MDEHTAGFLLQDEDPAYFYNFTFGQLMAVGNDVVAVKDCSIQAAYAKSVLLAERQMKPEDLMPGTPTHVFHGDRARRFLERTDSAWLDPQSLRQPFLAHELGKQELTLSGSLAALQIRIPAPDGDFLIRNATDGETYHGVMVSLDTPDGPAPLAWCEDISSEDRLPDDPYTSDHHTYVYDAEHDEPVRFDYETAVMDARDHGPVPDLAGIQSLQDSQQSRPPAPSQPPQGAPDPEDLDHPTLATNVRDWYQHCFPTDDLGPSINPDLAFSDALDAVPAGNGFYDALGVGDSVIRERVFDCLAETSGISYDDIYESWIHQSGLTITLGNPPAADVPAHDDSGER